jgi:hypothetical protein
MEATPMESQSANPSSPVPWYLNMPFDKYAAPPADTNFTRYLQDDDPLERIQQEKAGQSDRVLTHTVKAMITRLALERSQNREREDEASNVGNLLVNFTDEPFGHNQARDGMRWSLEQNMMALSRESRTAQLAFWNDMWTLSRELLTCMETHEKQNRRSSMVRLPVYSMDPRIP